MTKEGVKMSKDAVSIYIAYLLRHHPEAAGLRMDHHGWVATEELIDGINRSEKYTISFEQLQKIVAADKKGRYRFNEDETRIKACQGHSIPWVEPELTVMNPPEFLYHGTTAEASRKIWSSGSIHKMSRHAVHMQADPDQAWQSAERWHTTPVVLKIAARNMSIDGITFGVSDNGVWCTEDVPVQYIVEVIAK